MNQLQLYYTLEDQESDGDTPRPLRFKKNSFYLTNIEKLHFWDKCPPYPKTLIFYTFWKKSLQNHKNGSKTETVGCKIENQYVPLFLLNQFCCTKC